MLSAFSRFLQSSTFFHSHSFSVAAPLMCNSLPSHVHSMQQICQLTPMDRMTLPLIQLFIRELTDREKSRSDLQTQGHWQSCHSIGHDDFPLVIHCNYVSILHFFRGTVTYFQKFTDVMWPTTPRCKYMQIYHMANQQSWNWSWYWFWTTSGPL